jgi:hypothetical protein
MTDSSSSQPQPQSKPDPRIVFGTHCTWWDSIDKVGHTPPGKSGITLPCCPNCGDMLFEVPNIDIWWRDVDKHAEHSPGYREMMEYGRGRCFPTISFLANSYHYYLKMRDA